MRFLRFSIGTLTVIAACVMSAQAIQARTLMKCYTRLGTVDELGAVHCHEPGDTCHYCVPLNEE